MTTRRSSISLVQTLLLTIVSATLARGAFGLYFDIFALGTNWVVMELGIEYVPVDLPLQYCAGPQRSQRSRRNSGQRRSPCRSAERFSYQMYSGAQS